MVGGSPWHRTDGAKLARSLRLGEEGGEQLVMSFRMEGRLHKLAKRRRKATLGFHGMGSGFGVSARTRL